MVPRAGLEPAQSFDHEILSLARMPISPPRLLNGKTVLWATVTKPLPTGRQMFRSQVTVTLKN